MNGDTQLPTEFHDHHGHDGQESSPGNEADWGNGGHEGHGDEAHDGGGHGAHTGHHVEMFRRRFWWCLALSVPVVVTSEMVMDWLGYELDFPAIGWVGPILGSVVFWWGGWPFLEGARRELKTRQPGMMLLIGMAITVAYVASLATSLGWFDLDFWWELALLVTVMLLGHWQEMRALGQAQDALAALAALLPDEAERVGADGSLQVVAADELGPGDLVLVRSGGRVPADGTIVEGTAELDESMITGESKPVGKTVSDRVVAGTVSTDSAIRIRVDAVGEDTALAGIRRLVAEAQASRSRTQVLADRAAALLFYVATGAAAIAAVVWVAIGDPDAAVERAVTVLVISCPHALGLAIPLTTSISSALAARNGILVKDRLALELSRTVDTFLFDKTGTLTKGEHTLVGVAAAGPVDDEDEVLRVAGAVESDSEHPLARAIVVAARARGAVATAQGFRSITGRGVEAEVDGEPYAVGGPTLLREWNLDEPSELTVWAKTWKDRGATVLYLVRDRRDIVGGLALEDEVRPEARAAVNELKAKGRRVVMITGDARPVAEAVAEDVGVDEVFAEVLPEDKAATVAGLRDRGFKVAMVGDGVNDAPALAGADVGIAIGAGTDVAIESAGLILASSDPRAVLGIIRLSEAAYRKSLQNLWWAAGYNIVSIPLAAGALAWAGITMPPAVAAMLMSLSTIVVAANAQLLRRVDLRPPPIDQPEPVGRGPVSRAPTAADRR
jgi:Cu2+-exporting ATPase